MKNLYPNHFVIVVLSMLAMSCGQSNDANPNVQRSDQPAAASDKSPNDEQQAEPAAPIIHTISIVANVPSDAPAAVFLSGNTPQLGPWNPTALRMDGNKEKRTASVMVPQGYPFEFRITAGAWEQEGLGPDKAPLPAFKVVVDGDKTATADIVSFREDPRVFIEDWQGSNVEGELVYWTDVQSAFLANPRHVVIWLPPGYNEKDDKKYPVIYVQDGQNLFDPRMAYTSVDWGLDEAMMKGVRNGDHPAAIIVGIWNTTDRLREYSPWHRADRYSKFMLKELMPLVNSKYNVATDRDNTYVMGASMGGLLSFYLLKEHPDVFSACGCMSSHMTWSPQMAAWTMAEDYTKATPEPYIISEVIKDGTMPSNVRMYFDYGTKGLDADYELPHMALKDWLMAQGFEENTNFKMTKFEGDDHNEASWRPRVGDHIKWMLQEN